MVASSKQHCSCLVIAHYYPCIEYHKISNFFAWTSNCSENAPPFVRSEWHGQPHRITPYSATSFWLLKDLGIHWSSFRSFVCLASSPIGSSDHPTAHSSRRQDYTAASTRPPGSTTAGSNHCKQAKDGIEWSRSGGARYRYSCSGLSFYVWPRYKLCLDKIE